MIDGLKIILVLFPSAADKDRGRSSLFDWLIRSLGVPVLSSCSASISLACSLDSVACGLFKADSLTKYLIGSDNALNIKSYCIFEGGVSTYG